MGGGGEGGGGGGERAVGDEINKSLVRFQSGKVIDFLVLSTISIVISPRQFQPSPANRQIEFPQCRISVERYLFLKDFPLILG